MFRLFTPAGTDNSNNDEQRPATFNDLPIDLILLICKHLDLVSDVMSFMLTNKKTLSLMSKGCDKLDDISVRVPGYKGGDFLTKELTYQNRKDFLRIYFMERQQLRIEIDSVTSLQRVHTDNIRSNCWQPYL